MSIKVTKPRLVYNYDGEMEISFTVSRASEAAVKNMYEELKDVEVIALTAKKHRERRSLSANAYAWVLMDKIAQKMGVVSEVVYTSLIPDVIGNSIIQAIPNDTLDKYVDIWTSRGIGWLCETLGASNLSNYTDVICYWGSSHYDTAQMARLIDLIVQECKQLGIETKTPQELEVLLQEWEHGKKHNAK